MVFQVIDEPSQTKTSLIINPINTSHLSRNMSMNASFMSSSKTKESKVDDEEDPFALK